MNIDLIHLQTCQFTVNNHFWEMMSITNNGTVSDSMVRDAHLCVALDFVPWSQDDLLRLDDDPSLLGQASLQGGQDLHRWSRWITQW